jgi:hypothetical protein
LDKINNYTIIGAINIKRAYNEEKMTSSFSAKPAATTAAAATASTGVKTPPSSVSGFTPNSHIFTWGTGDEKSKEKHANTMPKPAYSQFQIKLIELINQITNDRHEKIKAELKKPLDELVINLKNTKQYTAAYTYLAIYKKNYPNTIICYLVDYLFNLAFFKENLRRELNLKDHFKNPVETAKFECELSLAILESAPKESLRKINDAIINYCKKHQGFIDHFRFYAELRKYHVEARNLNEFITLLSRDLSDPKNVSECATLHLIFFNYKQFFNPALDCPANASQINEERKLLHSKLHPKKFGEMFSPETRGRAKIETYMRSEEFGITETQYLGNWAQNWHRIKGVTPHKYRAAAIHTSDIVQTFREHRIPFISGPSSSAADCMEGISFLLPKLTSEEREEYFNLLAAAKVAQGHHSIHEVMLPCILINTVWRKIDYTTSYQDFLSVNFKKTNAYKKLSTSYPQFLHPEITEIESAVTFLYKKYTTKTESIRTLQYFFRVRSAYQELRKGEHWNNLITTNTNKQSAGSRWIKRLSNGNIAELKKELHETVPTQEEMKLDAAAYKKWKDQFRKQELLFIDTMMRIGSECDLTHYTNAPDAIKQSKILLSNSLLIKMNIPFDNRSTQDTIQLKNGSFVFFRYEAKHLPEKTSRFGTTQIMLKGRQSDLFKHGWVSLFEMYMPNPKDTHFSASIVRKFTSSESKGVLTFIYTKNKMNLNLAQTSFYGPDILYGIALSALRELRRIGGEFQRSSLAKLDADSINTLLYTLFRVEAKIPARVHTTNATITLPPGQTPTAPYTPENRATKNFPPPVTALPETFFKPKSAHAIAISHPTDFKNDSAVKKVMAHLLSQQNNSFLPLETPYFPPTSTLGHSLGNKKPNILSQLTQNILVTSLLPLYSLFNSEETKIKPALTMPSETPYQNPLACLIKYKP